jgi:hypothetical protein
VYYASDDPVPFCPYCYEKENGKRIHLYGPVALHASNAECWKCDTCNTSYIADPGKDFHASSQTIPIYLTVNKGDRILRVIRLNKEYTALEQLKSAMFLWFHEGDPVSIHTLAAAAHDCFYWLVKHENQESILREWMAVQSKSVQRRIADAQNFFKHGHKWLKRQVSYPVIYGELLMFDCVVCYGILFGVDDIPAILRLYSVRFMLEHPGVLDRDLEGMFLERDVIEELTPSSRKEFFETGLSLLGETFHPNLSLTQEETPE